MTKFQKEALAEALETSLEEANRLFKDGNTSKAYIVGYLEGTIKTVIRELKGNGVIPQIKE